MTVPDTTAMPPLACFRGYDVRARIGADLDLPLAAQIGAAFARVMRPARVVLGRDCRVSSPALASALAEGLMAQGVDVLDLGQAGTEEVYFATTHLAADGGIMVTASHNPADENGMKFVAAQSRPLTETEFAAIATQAHLPVPSTAARGNREGICCRNAYADHLAGLVDCAAIGPLSLVVNAGNGVAGAAFDAIAARLVARGAQLNVTRINHLPDSSFPNGIPNPLLPQNRPVTSAAVLAAGADLGIAWDGDFDRCFFFDHTGAFVDGEYIVGLLATAFLQDHSQAAIVHDPRVIWATQDQVKAHGGRCVLSRTGHTHIKRNMRAADAIYGGEMSAHHYFRDFMYCDSGMLPWLKLAELLGRNSATLADLVGDMRRRFPSSGERNFHPPDPARAIATVQATFADQALEIDHFDGLSMTFADWRLNLRPSATEGALRLNIEARNDAALVARQTATVAALLRE